MGSHPKYELEAKRLGRLMAELKIELIYGGGNVGLMGVIANASLEKGGTVIGVIPQSIADLEIAHHGLTQLHIVETMGERKELMGKLSDGFIAMPGGFGTLDELAEVLTYNQLRIYDKPIGFLNVEGYFDGLLKFFDHAVDEGFVRQEHRSNIVVSAFSKELIRDMQTVEPVRIQKWIEDIRKESSKN